MAKGKMFVQGSEIIFHYTSGQHLENILESGKLKVSEWERENKIKPPALWLSLNPDWEPTATKIMNVGGQTVFLTKEQQHEHAGLYRFVIPFDKSSLCSWGKYRYKSNTDFTTYLNMKRTGIEKGANPLDWYASFNSTSML